MWESRGESVKKVVDVMEKVVDVMEKFRDVNKIVHDIAEKVNDVTEKVNDAVSKNVYLHPWKITFTLTITPTLGRNSCLKYLNVKSHHSESVNV